MAPLWQVGVAALLALLATVVVVRVAGRIYRNSVLRTGARVSLREALGSALSGPPRVGACAGAASRGRPRRASRVRARSGSARESGFRRVARGAASTR